MGAVFRLTGNTVMPAPGVRVLRAADYARLVEANDVLAAARERAAAMAAEAEKAYEERRQAGYEDGLMEGRMEQAEKMMETAMQAVEYIENIEETLVKVVTSAVRKIIGELDERERIVRVVRTALVSVRSQQKVLIRVCPADEPAVREALAAMIASAPGGVSFLDVSADPRMKPGDCILESELGVVDAGLETQLRALENALAGKIKKGGLVEVPMGMTLKEVLFGIGGGIKNDRQFKAVQMGGPSGGCIPASLIDTPVTYEDINKTGAIVGSGGMIVMDEDTCMVDMARYFLNFTRDESCGKCNYCRIGTKRMLEILERITRGEGRDGDIELLEELAGKIKDGSLCGLGQTAPNPVLTTIKYFRNEYEDHIYNHKCTAASCKALVTYTITDACKGCTACARKCPVGAISGEVKQKHVIDKEKCIKCGKCLETCKFGAIEKK